MSPLKIKYFIRRNVFVLAYILIVVASYNVYPFFADPPQHGAFPWSSPVSMKYIVIITMMQSILAFLLPFIHTTHLIGVRRSRRIDPRTIRNLWLLIGVVAAPLLVYSAVESYVIIVSESFRGDAQMVLGLLSSITGLFVGYFFMFFIAPVIYWVILFRGVSKKWSRDDIVYGIFFMIGYALIFIIFGAFGFLIDNLIVYLTKDMFSKLVYLWGWNPGYYQLSGECIQLILHTIPSWGRLFSMVLSTIMVPRLLGSLFWYFHGVRVV